MASKSKDTYYSNYKATSKWKKNREKRLERALKRSPGNEAQIMAALGNIQYRRKTPTNTEWSSSKRRIAQLFKEFTGRCPRDVFSSNAQAANAALATVFGKHETVPEGKVDFSLAARSWSKNPV